MAEISVVAIVYVLRIEINSSIGQLKVLGNQSINDNIVEYKPASIVACILESELD